MHSLDRFFRRELPILAAGVIVTILVVGWVAEPDRFALGYSPKQPVPFSHRLHAGDNHIPCQYCHTGASRSRIAMIPPLDTCMNCHRFTKVDSPYIKQITAAYNSGEAFPWVRVYQLPDHVYFDHRPHVAAGIACQECHGSVEQMDRVSRVMNMRMGKCLECHRGERTYVYAQPKVSRGPENCNACHR